MIKRILFFFLVWKILIYLFSYLVIFFVPLKTTFTPVKDFGVKLPYLVWIFGNFDGVHYMEIARNGYHEFEHAFFPLYPLMIKIFSNYLVPKTFIPYLISGQIISNMALLVSVFLIYKLLVLDKIQRLFYFILALILLFPTSLFYLAVYNDSIFFLLATLTIYFSRKRYWILSCIFASLATLTRLNGLTLLFLIITEFLTNKNFSIEKTWNFGKLILSIKDLTFKKLYRSKILAVFLIPFSFAGYLLYTQLIFGKWSLVFSSMEVWKQNNFTFPLQVFWRYLKGIIFYPSFQLNYFIMILEFCFVLFYIIMIIYSYKKIRFSYWIFFVLSILIPSFTGTFQGMPRYGLHVFPYFLSLAILLEKRNIFIKTIYFILSISLLFLFTALFTRGYFIA